jgi:uncharacterized membrane protein
VALRIYKFFLAFLFLAGLFFVFLMVKLTLPYLSFRYDVDFLLTKQSVLHMFWWRAAFYVHITSSIIVLLTGLLQFLPAVLKRFPQVHRVLGKVYVFTILACSAPSGLVMAVYASGGFWARLSFALISLLWIIFTWVAFRKAVQRDFRSHTAFMYRSFALTLSAITLRSYVWLLPFFSHLHHLHGREMYVLVSWLSWVPNLLVSEWLIRRKLRSNKTARVLRSVDKKKLTVNQF